MIRHEEVVASAVAEQARRDREAISATVGRPVNLDTGNPFPSASASQKQLADNLYARLIDDLAAEGVGELLATAVRDALVEVAVRQHGRTLRACLDDLREQAESNDREAREYLDRSVDDDGTVHVGSIAAANTIAAAALTLRIAAGRVHGYRA